MPEGFQIKAMGTTEAGQNVQEEIKKKKCKAINHVLMWHENHPGKHTLGLWAQRELSPTVRAELAGREYKGMISTEETAVSTKQERNTGSRSSHHNKCTRVTPAKPLLPYNPRQSW